MSRRTAFARGHTLLELMIAMALGLVVTAGAISLYTSQRRAFESASNAMRIRDAGLTALTLVGQQLQMAGFTPAEMARYDAAPPLFGCSGGRPTGADDNLVCTRLSTGSDGIAVRYVGDAVSTWSSSGAQTTDCLGQGVSDSLALSEAPGALVVNRYFANVSTSTGEPELYCEGNGNSGSAQPLVEGVERLLIKYWLTGAADAVDASAVQAGQWADIVAVDLCVLVRGVPEARPARYVDCSGVSVLAGDSRPRQAFSRRVALRNRAGATL